MPGLDHEDLKDDRAAFEKRLAELGPDQVRTLMATGGLPTQHGTIVMEWLGNQSGARGAQHQPEPEKAPVEPEAEPAPEPEPEPEPAPAVNEPGPEAAEPEPVAEPIEPETA